MSSLRKQDDSTNTDFARSERIFDDDGLWYFRTREGGDIGPFRYESEAQQMLEKFITEIKAKEAAAAKPQKLQIRRNAIASPLGQTLTPAGLGH